MKNKINLIKFILIFLVMYLMFCQKLPYIPDENATIFLESIPSSINIGESTRIVISGEKGSGYPLPDGTIVYLSVSSGTIQNELELTSGRAEIIYKSTYGFSGEVIVTARSGKATISPEQLTITITEKEEPEIAYLFITADPMDLPKNGGKSKISVLAMGNDMLPVSSKNICLKTTVGSLSGGVYYKTDNNGEVKSVLTTTKTAIVTAIYKALSSNVTITVDED